MVQSDEQKLLAMLRKGSLKYCVLAELRDRERYGFEIASTLSAASLLAPEGTLYPLLARLRKEGLVESTWQESSQGPPRRYYALTAAGRSALKSFTEQWAHFRDAVDSAIEKGTS